MLSTRTYENKEKILRKTHVHLVC